jgi:hypothetical protein
MTNPPLLLSNRYMLALAGEIDQVGLPTTTLFAGSHSIYAV